MKCYYCKKNIGIKRNFLYATAKDFTLKVDSKISCKSDECKTNFENAVKIAYPSFKWNDKRN